eukprot:CAMPEP_0167813646 /NCGR_PEP_ID=MMETSP0112_2-20121227/1971_1 /TAXON_ID=91324 /ORGANISM="Lotharella globosa, Strain CCCM811" /LENGTH=56 /DNA_ID=CAMNT_0007712755 /DNA_START=1050 /DNA_END=1220 /DNA_ORIENTATION=-
MEGGSSSRGGGSGSGGGGSGSGGGIRCSVGGIAGIARVSGLFSFSVFEVVLCRRFG